MKLAPSCPSLPTALDDKDDDEVDGNAKERCRRAVREVRDGEMKACTTTSDVEGLLVKRARANNMSATADGAIFTIVLQWNLYGTFSDWEPWASHIPCCTGNITGEQGDSRGAAARGGIGRSCDRHVAWQQAWRWQESGSEPLKKFNNTTMVIGSSLVQAIRQCQHNADSSLELRLTWNRSTLHVWCHGGMMLRACLGTNAQADD